MYGSACMYIYLTLLLYHPYLVCKRFSHAIPIRLLHLMFLFPFCSYDVTMNEIIKPVHVLTKFYSSAIAA